MVTIYAANTTPEQTARTLQDASISGTAFQAVGFGKWGIEPTTVVIVSRKDAPEACRVLFRALPGEEAFYLTGDGLSLELYRDETLVLV